jgi:hypothetical protein
MATLQPAEAAPARFSISDAALEGFQDVAKHWRVIAGWALFNLVALVGGCILLVILLIGIVPFVSSQAVAQNAGAVLGLLVFGLGGLMVQVVTITGLYRLLLRPGEHGFLFLRLGRDELRVLGAMLLTFVAVAPLVILGGLLLAALARLSGGLSMVAAPFVVVAFYAVYLRLKLAAPLAFAEGRIDLIEAWRRTRGQTWRLLGMGVLLLCLLGMIATVIWIAVFVVGGLLTGFQDLGLSDAETVLEHPGRFLFQLAAEMLLTPIFLVISQAPWAAVYRALKP